MSMREIDLPFIDGRTVGLHGPGDERRKFRGLALQPNLPRRDPRHVEQIVNQAHEQHQLLLHLLADFLDDLRRVARDPNQLQARTQRRERIAQLVRQRREELVLASIGFFQLTLAVA